MNLQGLFFFLGLLVSDGASVIPAKGQKDGCSSTLAEIGERFEKLGFGQFPELQVPSDEEWIAIIEGELDNHDYTYGLNQTGLYKNTHGLEGSWMGNASLLHRSGDQQALLALVAVDSLHLGAFHSYTGSRSAKLVIDNGDNTTSSTSVSMTASFEVEKNGTYKRYGSSIAYTVGFDFEASKSVQKSSVLEINWVQSFDDVEVIASQVDGTMRYEKDKITVSGCIEQASVPLNGDQEGKMMPKDPVSLTQMLTVSAIDSRGFRNYSGDFTLGKTGTYNYKEDGTLIDGTGAIVYNSTSSAHGQYWLVNPKERHQQVPLSDLLVSITDLFH